MVATPGMLLNDGKEVEGGVCRTCRTSAIHMPLLPAQTIWLARRKGLQLLSSFLYYFSLSYSIWIDLAWELKLEGLSEGSVTAEISYSIP